NPGGHLQKRRVEVVDAIPGRLCAAAERMVGDDDSRRRILAPQVSHWRTIRGSPTSGPRDADAKTETRSSAEAVEGNGRAADVRCDQVAKLRPVGESKPRARVCLRELLLRVLRRG